LSKVKVFTDGASRGNPGESAIGILICHEDGKKIESYNEYLGTATNNQAEYKALLKSLELLKKLKKKINISKIEFYADSDLMVNQVNFDYHVKEPELALLNIKFQVLVKKLGIPYKISYIERSLNKEADRLANEAFKKRKKAKPENNETGSLFG
jgi:ribonuclease HI